MYKKYPFGKAIVLTAAAFITGYSASAQSDFSLASTNAKVVWKIKAHAEVGADSTSIFKPGYNAAQWVKATVPGTVFADYVNAGLEKDPNWGDNIYKVDKSKYDRNFWYRTEFAIPADFTKEKTFLNFKGINRKADVYVNGKKVGSLDGFMQPGHFDISGIVNKTGANVLAVLAYCPNSPLVNYASPTYISAAGWDWMPYVPGLNSGITDKVWLSNNGSLTIQSPWIRTDLPTNGRADLSVAVDVENTAPNFVQGELKGVIQPGNVEFIQKIYLGANSKGTVKFDKRKFAQLVINNPKLWWPNGYGEPNLYNCTFSVSVNGQVSDTKTIKFGIKKYTYDTIGNVLHIWINGTRVFLKGGNWGMSEYMLRCRGDEYFTKVRFHKEMNFNMIRNWIGSTTDDEFYEACDEYGIMIWDDFWLNSIANLPTDIYAFNMNAVEKIKRFRNHPSIAIWCGDNEGFPEPPLSGWLKENINTFDGNDRYY
ncbi:MAG: beta-mannosidase, partial [Sphingobacteriaceae bacterium]